MGIFELLLVITWLPPVLMVNVTNETTSSCDAAVHLKRSHSPVLSYTATFYTKWPPSFPKCVWTIVGDEECEVEISCKINIPKLVDDSDECIENFMRITDGSEGEMRVCGETELMRLRASEGLRDIFVILESNNIKNISRHKKHSRSDESWDEDIHCFAKCGTGKPNRRLPKNLKRKWEHNCICGMQKKPVKIENNDDYDEAVERHRRIVAGQDATMNEFPWQVAVVYKGTRRPVCGGSIINDHYILTAAHCFSRENYTAEHMEVLAHAHTLDLTIDSNDTKDDMGPDDPADILVKDTAESTQRYQVLEIIPHPIFSLYFVDFDIALLRISPPIQLHSSTAPTPVCIPKATTWDTLMPSWTGKLLTTTGWGKSSEDANSSTSVLQKLEDIPYIPFEQCIDKLYPEDGFRFNRRMICAGYPNGGKDACQGDSGGGLTLKGEKNKQHLQIGIVSWGEGCARNDTAGFYTRVTEFVQWIHFHSAEYGSKWCLEDKGRQ